MNKKYIGKEPDFKRISNILKQFENNYNFKYNGFIEASYDMLYNCDNGCDPYCRCGTLRDLECKEFDVDSLIDVLTKNLDSAIMAYCIDRVIRLAKLSNDSFEVTACAGYYGQEIGAILLNQNKAKKIHKNISDINSQETDLEKIKKVLEIEYGMLLDVVKDTKAIEIKTIDPIYVTYQQDYMKKIDISEDYYGENYRLPRGIFIESKTSDGESRYRLIDGYHRMAKANSLNMKKVKAIVLS